MFKLASSVKVAPLLFWSLLAFSCTPASTPTPTTTPTPAHGELVQAGKRVFIKTLCTGCHSVPGILQDEALLESIRQASSGCEVCHSILGIPETFGPGGPDLSRIGTIAAFRKPGMSAEEYIRESIRYPRAFTAPGFVPDMPENIATDLSEEEFNALVAFLLSLK